MNFLKKLLGARTVPTGEQTKQQGAAQAGMGVSQLPGFAAPQPGSYAVYRKMSAHPTIALAKSIVTAPILASSWSFETRRPDGTKVRGKAGVDPIDRELADRARFIARQIEPIRIAVLSESLRALEFGWRPFEKVWEVRGGSVALKKLKPLLPDFTFVQVDDHGQYAGLVQMDAVLGPEKSFIYTYDGEAGNMYGRSRHESTRLAWSNWHHVDERSGQLTTKVAAIIPMVHYPLGQSRDASGHVRDNGELADVILNGLGSGRGVKLPNLFASTEDPRLSADMAGKSAWVIGFLEAASAAQNLQGMTDRQRYYDALMFRGWLRPERSGLESEHGSRADADRHSDTALTDSELLHADVCDQINRQVIDEILTLNFGAEAAGSVYLVPSPLQESKRKVFADLLQSIWHDPQNLAAFVSKIDMDAVLDVMEIPKGHTPQPA